MEKTYSHLKHEQDNKVYDNKRSEINHRVTTKTELESIDGSYGFVPFEVAMKTPDKRHFVNYLRHGELVDAVDFRKVQESKPRDKREYKAKFQGNLDGSFGTKESYWATPTDRLKKVSRLGAKLLTREAIKNLDLHNTVIKDGYRVGTSLNDSAYSVALVEDKNREGGLELGTLVNKSSIDFSRLVKKNIDESATIFDKLDLVRERAYEFAGLDNRQYIKKNDDSTTVLGTSSKFVEGFWERGKGGGSSYTKTTPSAFELSVVKDDKSGKDKMQIDVYKFDELQNYYFPVTRTTLLKNDSALIEKYDQDSAQFSAPEKLHKDEVQIMYSHLILGDNILG